MNPIEKASNKLSSLEQDWVEDVIARIVSGRTEGLDIKKLRVIYARKQGQVMLLFVGRRRETTYNP